MFVTVKGMLTFGSHDKFGTHLCEQRFICATLLTTVLLPRTVFLIEWGEIFTTPPN